MIINRCFVATIVATALAGAGLGIAGGRIAPIASLAAATPPATGPVQSSQPRQAPVARALPDFSDLVEKYGPAVVNVSTMGRRQQEQEGEFGIEPGDPLAELYRRFQIPRGDVPVQGLGSGFIISPDGYILTNAHVVADASEVTVKLSNKRDYKAKVIGADKNTDVALIKIDATGLPSVVIGDPDRTKVGQWVAAIGSPFGFDHSVTAGIVSAKSDIPS